MTDSFQHEIPKARVNITLDVDIGNAKKKKELPLRTLIMSDFSLGKTKGHLAAREKITITQNNFDKVIEKLTPELELIIPNKIKNDGSEIKLNLRITKEKDFHPDEIVMQLPELKQLIAMRNLLKDLKTNIVDNKELRRCLDQFIQDKTAVKNLQTTLQQQAPLMIEGEQND